MLSKGFDVHVGLPIRVLSSLENTVHIVYIKKTL